VIEPGDILHGYCGGAFGRDGYGPHRVIAVGRDWVLCRGGQCGGDDYVYVANGDPAELEEYLTEEEYEG
jgi:hypothetical protein